MKRRRLNWDPGRIRYRLAEMLSLETGAVFEAHRITRNNPIHQHYEDVCAWDAWGTKAADGGGVKVHVYSWDRMGDCVRNGFDLLTHRGDHMDFEVCAKGEKKLPET